MANIGRVYQDSYKGRDGKEVKFIQLDLRTISTRKKFTISVNKLKYVDGIQKSENIIQGKEDHPDFHIWANFSNRGESLKSVIVGSVKNMVSQSGLAYKSAKIFDPFLSRYNLYFSLFSVSEEEKKENPNLLYNVVASPYQANTTNSQGSQETQANPSYASETTQTHTTQTGAVVDVDEETIPF